MQIFFSYGHDKHSGVVKALKEEIESQSNGEITVWMDTYKITRDSHWRKTITDGILNSESVIAFLSSYSAREESVCRDELSIALVSKHGMIRTVLLESLDSFTPPSRMSEYQWGDMSDYPEIEKRGEEVFKDYIKEEASKIIKLVTSDDILKYSDEVKQLRRAFHLPEIDDWTKFDGLIKEELIGRDWLLNRIDEWENDAEGSNILMLYGKPGVGKSMFSAHLQMRDSSVVAAFPCDCRHSEYSKTESIIKNISYRLALRLPDYRRYVLELLSDSSFDLGSDQLFDRLILNPLSRCNIDGERSVMVIVVDALDEMDNDELAKFISESAYSLRKYIRFIITSRKIPSITERFNRFPQIDLDNEEEESHTRADLAEYFESRLGTVLMDYEGKEGKEEFIERLIDNSDLVFTYAKCVCDNILEDIKIGDFQISDYLLPHGIEELFKQTLDRSFNSTNAIYTMNDYINFWQIPLGMILASPEPLPVSTMKTLMQWRERDLKKFIDPLSTFVLCENESLFFFHKSFGEWLNETKTTYAASCEDGISDLADACYNVYTEKSETIGDYILLYTTQFLRASKKMGHRKQYEEIIVDKSYTDKMFIHAEKLNNMNSFKYAMQFYTELLNIFDGEDIEEDECKSANVERDSSNRSENYNRAMNGHADVLGRYTSDLEYDIEIKILYELLGQEDIYNKEIEKKMDIVLEDFYEGLDKEKQLKEQVSDKNSLHEYSASLLRVAGICMEKNEIDKALKYCCEALEIKKQLKEKYSDDIYYLEEYSEALIKTAEIHRVNNDNEKALEYCCEALEIKKQLKAKHSEDIWYIKRYSMTLNKLAEIHRANNDNEKALEYYKEALEIKKKLKEKYVDDQEYMMDYSAEIIRIVEVYKAIGDKEKSLECYLEINEINRQLKENNPKELAYLNAYVIGLENVAKAYENIEEFEKASEYYHEANEIKKLINNNN